MNQAFAIELSRFGPEGLEEPLSLNQARAYCSRLARTHYENFTRRLAAAAAAAAAAFSRRLRLLPLGRRPGRRGRRRPRALAPAALVAARNCSLLRRPAAPSGHGRPARNHRALRHSAPAVPRSAVCLRAGPARQALPDLRPASGLLPLLGQPGRPPGPVPVRGFDDSRAGPGRLRLHRSCSWPTSGRTWPATSTLAGSIFPRRTAGGSAIPRPTSRAAASRPPLPIDALRGGYGPGTCSTGACRCWTRCRPEVRPDIELFIRGGLAILRKIEALPLQCLEAPAGLGEMGKGRVARPVLSLRPPERHGPVPMNCKTPGPLLRLLRTSGPPRGGQFLPCLPRPAPGPAPGHVRPVCLPAHRRRPERRARRGARASAPPWPPGGKPWTGPWPASTATACTRLSGTPSRASRFPVHYLEAVLDGVEMDLDPWPVMPPSRTCITTATAWPPRWDWRASTSGASRTQGAKVHAEKAGIAFQLTNILRDLGEDAARGRVYLPAEDLERFGYDRGAAAARRAAERRFRALMRFEVDRARQYYDAGLASARKLAARRPGGLPGDDAHLSRLARCHRAARLRRLQQPGSPEPLAQAAAGPAGPAGPLGLGFEKSSWMRTKTRSHRW